MSKRCLGCMELFGDEFEICPHCGYIVGTRAEEAIHMDPGTLLYDRYIVGKVLGYGGFGVTYLGWDGKLEQKVAIKEYLPGEFSTRMPGQSQVTIFNGEKNEQFHDGLKKFIEEAKHLAKFQNERGIVKIFDSFEENDTAYIIMEYLDGETLTEYLKREKTIPEDVAVAMLMPVMESLQAVHGEGLLHRDIAPDNIFLTKSGEVKLIDFGASRYATTSHSRSLTVIIKPGYSPEEQYRSRGDQGPHTDVYAIASTLYKMITGKTPPDAMERRAKYENQNKDILEEPHKINKQISVNRENAILNAMNVRIEDRTPDIATFIKDLNADPPVKRIYGKIKKIDLYAWPLWLKILVPSLLSVILILGVLLLTGVIRFSNFSEKLIIPDYVVTVPDVEGLYKDEALEAIAKGKLLAVTDGSIESEYIPAGKIILQNPAGGSYLDVNGTVLLTVSSGKSVASPENGVSTVPYVIWDEKDLAVSKLTQAGLAEPEIVEKHDENVSAGSVISQSIEAGTQVEEGTRITLTVSLGPAAFDMPDVVGKSKSDAEGVLNGKGLVVIIEYKKTDDVKENTVLAQSVSPGADVKRGDKITLTVSSRKDTVDVADVVGKDRTDAEKILKDQGFKVTVLENYDSNVPAGKVISQSPAAGTAQQPGATVVVYVSKGKQPITVTFDADGGKVSPASRSAYLSDAYDLPTPTKTGHTFIGWYSAKTNGIAVTNGTVITTPSDHTLYARWRVNTYTVSFDANGGSGAPAAKNMQYGAKYGTLNNSVSRTGYTFNGWYTAKSGGTKITADSEYSAASDQILYAQWKANKYTVSFQENGGSSVSDKTVTYDANYGDLPTPTKTGYTFKGWFTSSGGGTQITKTTTVKITANQTLYAQWTPISYTLTFNANGGSVSPSSRNVPYGAAYGDLPTPTQNYYTFDGWYTAQSGGTKVTSSTTMGAGNTTVYAHWTEKGLSGWILASDLPSGATAVEEKWTYTRTQTKESTSSSLSGWSQTGSYWKETGSGTYYYANFPSGYNTNDEIYKKYNHAALSSSQSTSSRRTVSSASHYTYVYWHWTYPQSSYDYNTWDRPISNVYGEWTGYGDATHWGAFESTTNYPFISDAYKAQTTNIYGASSYWWFRFSVYKQTYTDEERVYKYQKVTEETSKTKVSAGGEISNVKHYVRYRLK